MGYMTEVITSNASQSVYHNNPFIDKLTVKGDHDIPGGDNWLKWFATRAKEYDIFANLSHTCEVRHSLNVGTSQFWQSPEYRRKLCAGSFLETVHDAVGMPYDFGPLYFPTEEETMLAERVKSEQIKQDFICWVISGSRVDKVYPYAPFVIGRIIKELDIPIVMVGAGSKQREQAEAIKKDVGWQNSANDMLHIMAPSEKMGAEHRWGIRPSLNVVMLASLVVTPDTGIAWSVAMEPMPKVMMVSHASAENITKHWVNTTTLHADPDRVPCWPCHRLHDDASTCVSAPNNEGSACMADISVESILEAVKTAWANRKEGNIIEWPLVAHAH
jgi:hypothetical protein